MKVPLQTADWGIVEECFLAAAELSGAEREEFLDRVCSERPDLRELVEAMLHANEHPAPALERPVLRGALPQVEALAEASGTESVEDDLLGRRVGAYELVERLGSGGMGVVYRASRADAEFDKSVAIKLIRGGAFFEDVRTRFLQERQTLAQLEHPNIARLVDGGTADGVPYLVMEFVAGQPIDQWCADRRASVRDRLRLFLDVCSAVQHAHRHLVVHRDLKPANILVDREGRAKLLDFGISKILDPERPLATTQPLLTPEYASPEQVRGDPVSVATDVHALGIVLFELLAGSKPFARGGGTAHAVLMRICTEDPPLASSAAAEEDGGAAERRTSPGGLAKLLHGDIDNIIARALRKEPELRYASVDELAADVRRYLAGHPVLAHPTSFGYRASKFLKRNWPVVVPATLGVLALLVAVGAGARAVQAGKRALRLSDAVNVANARGLADELWPAIPETVPRYRAWLEEARGLRGRLLQHRAALADVRDRGTLSAEGAWSFEDAQDEWLHTLLAQLVVDLESLLEGETSTLRDVERRLAFAESVRSRSLEEAAVAQRWSEAVRSIADRSECPAYEGLRITPQLGLVPLGKDPDSGLWEFAHLQTGEVPTRDPATGKLALNDSSGLVFVLLPGGRSTIGSQASDATGVNYWPSPGGDEGPVHEVALEPYFLSKFEFTQSQWSFFTGENPSAHPVGVDTGGGFVVSALNPVESIDWFDCERVLGRLGLTLPTEAQWEAAARGGTDTPWWTGTERYSLEDAENLADQALFELVPMDGVSFVEWNDGFPDHAPVGSYRANAFGLHDMAGNVSEWCRDWYLGYASPVDPADGERLVPEGEEKPSASRIYRGGNYRGDNYGGDALRQARSGFRNATPPNGKVVWLGVRPARPVGGRQ